MKDCCNKIMAGVFCGLWGICLLLMAGIPAGHAAKDVIYIVTPEWEGQTQADGSGLLFDIVRQVYAPIGIDLRFDFNTWEQAILKVSEGHADAMLSVWRVQGQEKGMVFPRYPLYIEETGAILKKASVSRWEGIQTLDHKKAVWLAGYDYHTTPVLASVQLGQWTEVDTPEQAWSLLNRDEADVYIDAAADMDRYLQEHGMDPSLYIREIIREEPAFIAFSDTAWSRHLIAVYEQRIPEMITSGELAAIFEKWQYPFDASDFQP